MKHFIEIFTIFIHFLNRFVHFFLLGAAPVHNASMLTLLPLLLLVLLTVQYLEICGLMLKNLKAFAITSIIKPNFLR